MSTAAERQALLREQVRVLYGDGVPAARGIEIGTMSDELLARATAFLASLPSGIGETELERRLAAEFGPPPE